MKLSNTEMTTLDSLASSFTETGHPIEAAALRAIISAYALRMQKLCHNWTGKIPSEHGGNPSTGYVCCLPEGHTDSHNCRLTELVTVAWVNA